MAGSYGTTTEEAGDVAASGPSVPSVATDHGVSTTTTRLGNAGSYVTTRHFVPDKETAMSVKWHNLFDLMDRNKDGVLSRAELLEEIAHGTNAEVSRADRGINGSNSTDPPHARGHATRPRHRRQESYTTQPVQAAHPPAHPPTHPNSRAREREAPRALAHMPAPAGEDTAVGRHEGDIRARVHRHGRGPQRHRVVQRVWSPSHIRNRLTPMALQYLLTLTSLSLPSPSSPFLSLPLPSSPFLPLTHR